MQGLVDQSGNPAVISTLDLTMSCSPQTPSLSKNNKPNSMYIHLLFTFGSWILQFYVNNKYLLLQLIAEQQDEQLELVSGTIGVLKNMSQRIGQELDEQAV